MSNLHILGGSSGCATAAGIIYLYTHQKSFKRSYSYFGTDSEIASESVGEASDVGGAIAKKRRYFPYHAHRLQGQSYCQSCRWKEYVPNVFLLVLQPTYQMSSVPYENPKLTKSSGFQKFIPSALSHVEKCFSVLSKNGEAIARKLISWHDSLEKRSSSIQPSSTDNSIQIVKN